MPTDIDTHIRSYFDWVEEFSGCELRPPRHVAHVEHLGPPPVGEVPGDDPGTGRDPADDRSRWLRRSTMLTAAAAVLVVVAGLAVIDGRNATAPAHTAEMVPTPPSVSSPDPTPTAAPQKAPATTPTATSAPTPAPVPGAERCAAPVSSPPSPWDGCVDMQVYMNANATADEIDIVREALLNAPQLVDASQLRYLDEAAALEAAGRELVDEPEALALLNEDNIITMFKILAVPSATDADLRNLGAALQGRPGVRSTALRGDAALLAIGDQVMLGAAGELTEQGFAVDAMTSRNFGDVADIAAELRRRGVEPNVVVISVGTNGAISSDDLDRSMVEFARIPRVIVLTIKPNSVTGTNNDLIRALPLSHPNVEVLDWATAAERCPGECFYQDGIHLQQDGQTYLADLVAAAIDDGFRTVD